MLFSGFLAFVCSPGLVCVSVISSVFSQFSLCAYFGLSGSCVSLSLALLPSCSLIDSVHLCLVFPSCISFPDYLMSIEVLSFLLFFVTSLSFPPRVCPVFAASSSLSSGCVSCPIVFCFLSSSSFLSSVKPVCQFLHLGKLSASHTPSHDKPGFLCICWLNKTFKTFKTFSPVDNSLFHVGPYCPHVRTTHWALFLCMHTVEYKAELFKKILSQKGCYDRSSQLLPPRIEGQVVRSQTPQGYDCTGVVKELRKEPRSYFIHSGGKTYRRNCRHIDLHRHSWACCCSKSHRSSIQWAWICGSK